MDDLTVIYYTANRVKPKLGEAVRKQLLRAIDGFPLISVSQEPMDFGQNIVAEGLKQHPYNIYRQLLIGAKAAKTEYIACAEDDLLYSREHFVERRPTEGKFLYDLNKWGIYTWTSPPIFSRKERNGLCMMIAQRELLIEALEERFAKYPTIESWPPYPSKPNPSKANIPWASEPGRYEKVLKVTVREIENWESSVPSVVFSHPEGTSSDFGHKAHGPKVTEHLDPWGNAKDVLSLYE